MIEAILFDFDGVLTTDKTGTLTTTRFIAARTGIDPARLLVAFRKFNPALTIGKATHAGIWDDLCAELGERLDPALLDAAFASTPMDARMLELARALRVSYAVGIVTDNKKDRMDRLKALHHLPELFDPIVVSAEVGSDKEGPAIFEAALRLLGMSASSCVFIDNTRGNLVSAARLGMKTVYFDDEVRDLAALSRELSALGVRVGAG